MGHFELHEEDSIGSMTNRRLKNAKPSLTDRLINWGIVKDESQAKMAMIAFIVIGFALIIYMNMSTFATAPIEAPAAETI